VSTASARFQAAWAASIRCKAILLSGLFCSPNITARSGVQASGTAGSAADESGAGAQLIASAQTALSRWENDRSVNTDFNDMDIPICFQLPASAN
jgi:hypothetical protein